MSKSVGWAIRVVEILALITVLLSLAIPNRIRSGPGWMNGIYNNLRRLDGAKQQWAIDHSKTGAVAVTEQDLAPYLRDTFRPVVGERYSVKTLLVSPEAQLTRSVEGHPKGTVVRFNTNGVFELILP